MTKTLSPSLFSGQPPKVQPGAMDAAGTQSTIGAAGPGHPTVKYGRIGVLIVNLGTPDAHELLADAPLSEGVPLRPAGDRGQSG